MNLSDELLRLQTIFIDTAPIIYYIEAQMWNSHKNFLRSSKMVKISDCLKLQRVSQNWQETCAADIHHLKPSMPYKLPYRLVPALTRSSPMI
jgi:hypothetical protein